MQTSRSGAAAGGAITIRRGGLSGTFATFDAAYFALRWWHHDATRRAFEACGASATTGTRDPLQLKQDCEQDADLSEASRADYDGLGALGAMLLVLRAKWSIPRLRKALVATRGTYLLEASSDPVDDTGSGAASQPNRLGAALMFVRDELLKADGLPTGWPAIVPRPSWLVAAAAAESGEASSAALHASASASRQEVDGRGAAAGVAAGAAALPQGARMAPVECESEP